MYISKNKVYNQFSIAELKNDLKIDQEDEEYTGELNRLLKTSVGVAEKYIGGDIVSTTNTLEDYYVNCSFYQINEPNITVSSVTLNDSTQVTGFTTLKFNQYTLIKFPVLVSADKISIVYSSGYASIPADIQRAILIKMGEFLDADKNGWISGSLKETKAFERLLNPYVNNIY